MSDAGTMYANAKALHELLQESRAENAELRKERDALDRLTDVLDDTNDGLLAENARLRELVRDMWDWLAPTAIGGGAPLQGIVARMRELGVDA